VSRELVHSEETVVPFFCLSATFMERCLQLAVPLAPATRMWIERAIMPILRGEADTVQQAMLQTADRALSATTSSLPSVPRSVHRSGAQLLQHLTCGVDALEELTLCEHAPLRLWRITVATAVSATAADPTSATAATVLHLVPRRDVTDVLAGKYPAPANGIYSMRCPTGNQAQALSRDGLAQMLAVGSERTAHLHTWMVSELMPQLATDAQLEAAIGTLLPRLPSAPAPPLHQPQQLPAGVPSRSVAAAGRFFPAASDGSGKKPARSYLLWQADSEGDSQEDSEEEEVEEAKACDSGVIDLSMECEEEYEESPLLSLSAAPPPAAAPAAAASDGPAPQRRRIERLPSVYSAHKPKARTVPAANSHSTSGSGRGSQKKHKAFATTVSSSFSAACSPAMLRAMQLQQDKQAAPSFSSATSTPPRQSTEHKQQINPLSTRTPPRSADAVPWSSLSFLSSPSLAQLPHAQADVDMHAADG